MVETEWELKFLLMKLKGWSVKGGLNSTFLKIRSWHPVPSCTANKWEKLEIVTAISGRY